MARLTGDPLAAHRALSLWSRVAILAHLRQAGAALSSADLARETGLHVNTVRFHLEVLAEAGLVEDALEHLPRRGRPRRVFSATAEVGEGGDSAYRMLAQVLAEYLAGISSAPRRDGEQMGREWGSRLARGQRRSRRPGVEQVVAMMAQLGFRPTLVQGPGGLDLELRACPFLDVAQRNQELVCSAHLGLLRGALSELGLGATATGLDPLVAPSLCVAHLRPAGAPQVGAAHAPSGAQS